MTLTPKRMVTYLFVSCFTVVASVSAQTPVVTDGYLGAVAPAGETYFDAGACNSCSGNVDAGCSSGGESGLFGKGWIKKSDHAFDSFISPITNPVYFEDPRALTQARALFLNHNLPLGAGGGEVQLYALAFKARLSENVSLIATKDGYVTSNNPLVRDGWADLAAGLKFTLLRDVCNQRLLSGGFTFEMPTGEADALQGNGNGELNLFLTGARALGAKSHWMAAGGVRLPMNPTDESTSAYFSNHLDYEIRPGVYLLSETNWYHWLRSGVDGPLPGIEGLDLINLGSPGVAGNDIVTTALGVKLKPRCNTEIGVAYEVPVTDRKDIMSSRLTADWIIRY